MRDLARTGRGIFPPSAAVFGEDIDLSWGADDREIQCRSGERAREFGESSLKLADRITNQEVRITEKWEHMPQEFLRLLENYRLNDGLEYIWDIVRKSNKYIEDEKPWELAKTDTEKFETVMKKKKKKKNLNDPQLLRIFSRRFCRETSENIRTMLAERRGGILFSGFEDV